MTMRRIDGENVCVNNLQKLAKTLLALPLEVVQLAPDEAENVQRRTAQDLRGKTKMRAHTRMSDLFSLSCGARAPSLLCAFCVAPISVQSIIAASSTLGLTPSSLQRRCRERKDQISAVKARNLHRCKMRRC